jgi:solute carrier family 25 carnitine/acylcarnitine transporter 20/29
MTLLPEIAGATGAGCASTLLGHPLDTIKVHLQTNPKLSSTLHATTSLLQNNAGNPLVFFRGMAPPLVNAVVMNTVMFSVFRSVKQSLPDGTTGALTAGFLSGLATACLSTPTDFVKIQSQLRGIRSATVLAEIARTNPVILCRGHVANLGREGLFTMVYLGLYDRLMLRAGQYRSGENAGLLHVAAISSLTGGLAWVASYPFDTIKTVMQGSRDPVLLRAAVRDLWKRGGWKAFYKGCGASTGRAMLVTSTRMIVYESILGSFRENKDR